MPGHNAFQRNAFQRNAFQIVYNFAPTVEGGIVLGGDVTAAFRHRYKPQVDGGIVLGGAVKASFHQNGHHTPTVEGGIVLGGAVRARFTPGVIPVVRSGGGGRNLLNIFRRKHHYKAKVRGGLVLGGKVRAEFYFEPPVIELVTLPDPETFIGRTRGGITLGGAVRASFVAAPIPEIRLPLFPERVVPEPVHYKSRVGTRQETPIIAAGIKARFTSNPPPPRRIPYFSKLRQQIQEEDELLLMGVFDD